MIPECLFGFNVEKNYKKDGLYLNWDELIKLEEEGITPNEVSKMIQAYIVIK